MKHNMSRTPTHKCWRDMKDRCYNPNNKSYKNYGGRGIFVCERWKESFENFFMDVGEKPINKTLERIDNNGPYTKSNCMWVTIKQQSRNRRSSKLSESDVIRIRLLISENKYLLKDIARMYNVSPGHISHIKNERKWK